MQKVIRLRYFTIKQKKLFVKTKHSPPSVIDKRKGSCYFGTLLELLEYKIVKIVLRDNDVLVFGNDTLPSILSSASSQPTYSWPCFEFYSLWSSVAYEQKVASWPCFDSRRGGVLHCYLLKYIYNVLVLLLLITFACCIIYHMRR